MWREDDFDGTLLLPTKARSCVGMATICDACRENIEDEYFIGAIRKGISNMKFHTGCIGGQNDPIR